MASTRPAGASTSAAARKTFFEQQRELLLGEIAMVLANINKLNRSLEAVVTVGNEFSAVEALWSQFESVMAKEPEQEATAGGECDEREHDQEQQAEEGEDKQMDDNEDEGAATQHHDEEETAAATQGGRRRTGGGDGAFDY
ncbi:Dolichyl-diphosphooligosaccharide-protein glycosyltransferase subunit dad1 [Sporothrix eucalyptigena]